MSLEPILCYPSDFGDGVQSDRRRPPKRLRRMSKRKIKRWLARELQAAWDAAKVQMP
jgi:hypothetical protein